MLNVGDDTVRVNKRKESYTRSSFAITVVEYPP